MQLENKFTIDAPIEKAWVALNTPDMIAPCFPGATLTSYEGESFEGTVKVKLGPISLTYKGKGTYVGRDDDNHKVTIEASGRDSRGNGTASATVTGTMVADGPDRTAVTMVTDMTITGRPAQFGRGVISDVADKIIGQFAACVARKLAPQEEAVAAAAGRRATGAPARGHGHRRHRCGRRVQQRGRERHRERRRHRHRPDPVVHPPRRPPPPRPARPAP
jgi:carbon monoxide dehydrogenase subunit G